MASKKLKRYVATVVFELTPQGEKELKAARETPMAYFDRVLADALLPSDELALVACGKVETTEAPPDKPNVYIVQVDEKYAVDGSDDCLREIAADDMLDARGRKQAEFKPGDRVILPANKKEGWRREEGTVL